jgi:hypothetical protein
VVPGASSTDAARRAELARLVDDLAAVAEALRAPPERPDAP